MKQVYDEFLFGVCYYPEHWEKSDVRRDFSMMKQLGFNVVRMGEFSWSKYEINEGEFDFTFLQEAVELCAEFDLLVILGTPTAAPPVWLSQKHPEILYVDSNGATMRHGSRQHHNHTAKIYLEYVSRIVTKMAETFAGYENVIGWQIDNELNCHRNKGFAESDNTSFQEWLKDRYGTIENLNSVWGNVFWSLEFNDFSQITTPVLTTTHKNPTWLLDYYRFISDSVINYSACQYSILKAITPDKFITHNGMFDNIDYSKLARASLEFLSYDSYPAFGEREKRGMGRDWSRKLSRVRGVSQKFLILEQQSGPGGQLNYLLPTPEPGQIRLWTYQSIAHGAAGVLYFRWRTAPFGAEQLWHGILDYDSLPNMRYEEIAKISSELKKVANIFRTAHVENKVAIYTDYDNQSNLQIESFTKNDEREIYSAFNKMHIGVDFIYDLLNINQYKVIILPHISIATEKMASILKQYVNDGGVVVFGARNGMKDLNNHYYKEKAPGVFGEMAGITVEWFTTLPEYYEQYIDFECYSIKTERYIEVLKCEKDVEVLATYRYRHYKEKPAVVKRGLGKGVVYYFGAYFTDELAERLAGITKEYIQHEIFDCLPEYIEVSRLISGNKTYCLLLNYNDTAQLFNLNGYIDMLSGKPMGHCMNPYEVALIELN